MGSHRARGLHRTGLEELRAGASLGLQLQSEATQATSVWPPSGIALAALLLFGPEVAPGIFLGAVAADLADFFAKSGAVDAFVFQQFARHPGEVAMVGAIGLGNTLGALSAAYLLRRLVPDGGILDNARSVAVFVTASLACSLIGSLIGVATLELGGALPSVMRATRWLVWWLAMPPASRSRPL